MTPLVCLCLCPLRGDIRKNWNGTEKGFFVLLDHYVICHMASFSDMGCLSLWTITKQQLSEDKFDLDMTYDIMIEQNKKPLLCIVPRVLLLDTILTPSSRVPNWAVTS
jgi:hypothetical protein